MTPGSWSARCWILAWNGMPIAITDISATCHMPDAFEAPYRPRHGWGTKLQIDTDIDETAGGRGAAVGWLSCLAGDVIAGLPLPNGLEVGQRFMFLTRRITRWSRPPHSTVLLLSIWPWDSATDSLECIMLCYEDFHGLVELRHAAPRPEGEQHAGTDLTSYQ